MTRRAAIALLSLAFIGCAEKSDSQQVTDAIKAEVRDRGKPSSIRCTEAAGYEWQWCVVVLPHSRMNRANCLAGERNGQPVVRCTFHREEQIVIF
jgi:hypothetical protein